jgi:hypothetical protein
MDMTDSYKPNVPDWWHDECESLEINETVEVQPIEQASEAERIIGIGASALSIFFIVYGVSNLWLLGVSAAIFGGIVSVKAKSMDTTTGTGLG